MTSASTAPDDHTSPPKTSTVSPSPLFPASSVLFAFPRRPRFASLPKTLPRPPLLLSSSSDGGRRSKSSSSQRLFLSLSLVSLSRRFTARVQFFPFIHNRSLFSRVINLGDRKFRVAVLSVKVFVFLPFVLSVCTRFLSPKKLYSNTLYALFLCSRRRRWCW